MCAMTRTTEQYFLIRSSDRAFCAGCSAARLAYLVNAFFFDLYQFCAGSAAPAPDESTRLVEATLGLVRDVLGPDGGERAKAAGRLDVADNTDDDHRRRLDDGDGLDDLLLVHLCVCVSEARVEGATHSSLVARARGRCASSRP